MGNYTSSRRRASSSAAAGSQVILADGTLTLLDAGTSVAELMLEHPRQFVVEFGSLLSGAKAAPLPADQKLVAGSVYVMLPMKPGKKPTVSAAEARQALSRTRSVLRSGSFPSYSSWSGPLTKSGDAADDVWRLNQGTADAPEFSTPAFGEVPEFLSRQLSGRPWKPSLHTIEEKAPRRKVQHWLF